MKFCSGGKKMRNAWVHQGAMSDVKKKNEQKNKYDISPKKRVTRKFLKVSRCSRTRKRQRNVQKSVLHVQNCFLAN